MNRLPSAALVLAAAWLVGCGSSEPAAAPAATPSTGIGGAESTAVTPESPASGGATASSPGSSGPGVSEELPVDAPVDGDGALGSGAAGSGSTDAGVREGVGGAGGSSSATPPAELGPVTIWLAGDSTVANGQTPCPRGWGRSFAALFDERVTVNNSAAGGRSVHTWLYNVLTSLDEDTGECELTRDASGTPTLQPRWQAMLEGMRAGDYLFIQFGINDGDRNCDRHVGIEAFEAAYAMMAEAARERGANPVFVTPVSMVRCTGTTAVGSRGDFVPATIEVGQALGVPVIDLHQRSIELYQSLGFCPIPGGDVSAETSGPVGDFFCDDHTHFSDVGAPVIAAVVAQALAEQGIPLSAYLR